MKIEPRTLKGFRDFLPTDARKRQYVINTLKSVFELYGFEPLETPSLEYAEILTGKYGEEGDKLMYKFTDNGGREVALRYDQTVPLARAVAQNKDKLPTPFKRYQIQNVWRAENTQKGRFREFLQCDIDTVGIDSSIADTEIITCVMKCLNALGFTTYKILLNDRENLKFTDGTKAFSETDNAKIVRSLDKLKKIGEEGVIKELINQGFSQEVASSILKTIMKRNPTERLKTIIENLKKTGISSEKYEFTPTLARGLDYYTGLIMEVEIGNYTAGSIGGGGRYDQLIGIFSEKQIPAVGFAFGFDRLLEAMETLELFPPTLTTTKVLILNLPEIEEKALEVTYNLRAKNINTEIYLDSNIEKVKQFQYAIKKNIPYTILINNDGTYTLGWKESGKIRKEILSYDKLLVQLNK